MTFHAFGLVLLPTLTFVGLVTFERALQSGMEDLGYARRIDLLRGYYFDEAPELTSYLMSLPGPERLRVLGLGKGRWQAFRSVAAIVPPSLRSTRSPPRLLRAAWWPLLRSPQ